MTAEKRRFGMHQNLLYDVILRQAGTLQKALLEGAMNCIDAGASECRITLDTHSFSISDDGHGFQSRQEIEDFFEMFGTPHEEGDATYGRFRMGRGQLMAFGKNVWRSRTFEMHVDIKGSGLDYDLFEGKEDQVGTQIDVELYDPILPSDLERIKAELRRFVAWAQIPVLLNGEQINKSPSEGKWDFEDEFAYYSLSADRQQLAVYNLGVLVNSFWSGRFGIGGTVVSKKQLEVNFARNDVQSICPNFKSINAHIKKIAGKGVQKKVKMTDAERDMMVRDFLAGDISSSDAAKLRCITDVNGRSWPIDKLVQLPSKFNNRIIVAQRGDQMIETAQQRGIAFSIDETTLERFGVADGEAFLKRVADCAAMITKVHPSREEGYAGYYRLKDIANSLVEKTEVVDRDHLSQFVSENHIALEPKELTADAKILLSAIERGYQDLIWRLNRSGYEDRTFEPRRIRLGKSDTALAWTDGTQTIWVDLEHARLLRRGMIGAFQVATTLLHEQLHEGPDTGTHQHDFNFYQAFHDMTALDDDPLGACAKKMVSFFISRLRQSKKKVSKALLAEDDFDVEIAALRDEIEEASAA